MNLQDVQTEVGEKLGTIAGLRVYPYSADRAASPCAIVGLPERIDYDRTYRRGSDSMTLHVLVLVSKTDDRASSKQMAAYADGSGARSVKAALESSHTNTYSSCDDVHVSSVEFDIYSLAGVDLLGAEFTVDISGQGGA